MAVALALCAGLCYANAAVWQQRVASRQPAGLSLSPRLLLALIRHPLWLLGIAFDVVAFGLEAAALDRGELVTVGPLLVSGLVFALPLSVIGRHERVTRREWIPAIAVVGGLSAFIAVGSPEGGHAQTSAGNWAIASIVVAGIAGAAILAGRASAGPRRALMFGVATGTIYALTAVLTKATVDVLDRGFTDLVTSWQLYLLLAVSGIGLLVNQSAFQAGHVGASLPAIATINPVLASVFGLTLFDERLAAHGPLELAVTVVAIGIMVAGTISLATSPLVTRAHSPDDEDPPVVRSRSRGEARRASFPLRRATRSSS